MRRLDEVIIIWCVPCFRFPGHIKVIKLTMVGTIPFPRTIRKTRRPTTERGVDSELRTAQIEFRLCEIEEAYRVLKIICAGDGETIARQNFRGPDYVGGTSKRLEGVDWVQWRDKFEVDKITMAGHSFGAANSSRGFSGIQIVLNLFRLASYTTSGGRSSMFTRQR